MTITFGGLATGMDTGSIITQLMEIERMPITRLQGDKTWLSSKLTGYTEFDGKLNGFLASVRNFGERDSYYQNTASTGSDEFFTANASNEALNNVSYQVEVITLAQVQKSYTAGFASETDQNFGTGDMIITVDGVDHTISIDDENNSLQGIMQALNDADIGVQASIINDGNTDPYRLTFTGNDVGTAFSIDSSGLTGGSGQTLGVISESQPATQAHIKVDNIDIYSDSNTIADSIPGVTLDLVKAEEGTTTTININQNHDAITANINAFITGYNDVVAFVTGQSTLGDTAPGVLGGDSGLTAIKRHLQDMLTMFVDTGGTFSALSQLGLETQKDGQLSLDSAKLTNAIESDLDSVVNLLAGQEDGDGGMGAKFEAYLADLTNSTNGLLAGRENSINDNIARIDKQIALTETRLEKREQTLQKQFNAMELLVSGMNAQSSFLTTQLKSLESLWNYNR